MSVRKGQANWGQTVKAPVMSWTWDRNTGETEQFFRCGSYAYLKDTVAPDLMDDYDTITIDQVGGDVYKLVAARTGENQQHIHEVRGSNLTQQLISNLKLKAAYLAIAGKLEANYVKDFVAVTQEADKVKRGEQTVAAMRTAIDAIPFTEQLADDYADELLKFGDEFLNAQYCYTHTIVLPDRSYNGDLGFIYNNTHRIFTESALRSAEDIPSYFALPKAIVNGGEAEWLKQPTTDSLNSTTGRRTIVLEYLFADVWSPVKYDPAA